MPKNLGIISDPKDIITKEYLDDKLNTKVDAVDGKGLSVNDFTNDYKTKLDGLSNPVAITIDEIDAICNATIYAASEVSV